MELASTFLRASAFARSGGAVLLPHAELFTALGGPLAEPLAKRLRSVLDPMEAVGFWSGTIVAYEGGGKPLGEKVLMPDRSGAVWSFDVPPEHRGKQGVILVCEPGGYSIHEEKSMVSVLAAAASARAVPLSSGWYLEDGGFPRAPALPPMNGSYFYLSGPHVGPSACMFSFLTDGSVGSLSVSFETRPSYRLGALVSKA